MNLNKNKIFGYSALGLFLLGTALILIGVLRYKDHAIGFGIVGVAFYLVSWAFNALRGRL